MKTLKEKYNQLKEEREKKRFEVARQEIEKIRAFEKRFIELKGGNK